MSTTDVRTTDQLREGQVLRHYGARLLLDTPPVVHHEADKWAPPGGRTVYAFDALCLNPEDPRVDDLMRRFIKRDGGRYTVQGTNLARWYVETVGE